MATTTPSLLVALQRQNPPPCREEIQSIVRTRPGVAQRPLQVDYELAFAFTPLEIAVANRKISAEAIEYLIDQWPESLREVNFLNGDLPIHVACQRGCSLDVLKALIKRYPESLSVKGSVNTLPLHRVFWSDSVSLEAVKFLVDQHPKALQQSDKDGILPLHNALQEPCASHDIVKFIVDAYPESLLIPAKRISGHYDDVEALPIHFACNYGASLETIQYLIERCPESLQRKNKWGKLPLEVAFTGRRNNMPRNVLNLLLEKTPTDLLDPERLMLANARQWTSFEEEVHVNLPVIQYLLEKYPRLAKWQSPKGGELPLHISCRHFGIGGNNMKGADGAFKSIINVHPVGLFVGSGKRGRTPLEELKQNKQCTDTVRAMVEKLMREMLASSFNHLLPVDTFDHVLAFLM